MITDELNALLNDKKISKTESDVYLVFEIDHLGSALYKTLRYNNMMFGVPQLDPTTIAVNYGRQEVFREIQETIDTVNKLLEELRHGKSSK